MVQSWHAVREGVVGRVCQILGGGQEPRLAALTGRSGAGKTTAASAMVGGLSHIRIPVNADETEDQTRTRLDRVRTLFSHGVVWLRVGRGAGAPDRLRPLMHGLAKAVHEDVMGRNVDAPAVGEDGQSYVKKIMLQERLRCLVVADDVWDEEVVEKLRETGMWVLMTTRKASMVGPNERVVVDKLTQTEAEDVLRGAARLPPGERLCDDVMQVLEICGHVAMDIAFVGSWSCVRTADNGIPKSKGVWADALRQVATQIDELKARALLENATAVDDLDVNRRAVLLAGFKFLGAEDPLAQELYMMLAVFPDGHAFKDEDAAVLLNDEEPLANHRMEVVTSTIAILERWAVLRADASGLYRMHDAHVALARCNLMDRGDIRRSAIRRWTSHISRLEVVLGMDVYPLLDIWRAVEQVGGDSMRVSRPYDDQLVQMNASDRSKTYAVNIVATLYEQGKKFGELEALMRKVVRDCDNDEDANPEVKMAALFYIRESLLGQGRFAEADETKKRLGELARPSLEALPPVCGDGFAQTSISFNTYGVCAEAAGRRQDAEKWFRKALKVQEDGGLGESSLSVFTLVGLGECVRKAGRRGEAEGLFFRALKIAEAKLGLENLQVSWTLDTLGRCVREAGRPGEGEGLLKRALEIKEANLGEDDPQIAVTLGEIGRCVREAGRPGEAEAWFKRALAIKEVKLGPDDVRVAWTLGEMGRCVREAGRPGEAEELVKRALAIQEAKLGNHDLQVAWILHEMGRCVREAGRAGDAREWFLRALDIRRAKLGNDDLQIGLTLHEMGVCVREAGRPGEAEGLLKRALAIEEAKLGNDDLQIASTLHQMGRCMREAGRPREAEGMLQRSLDIKEAQLGNDDLEAAATQQEMGVCAREAGRPREAEGMLKQALETKEAKLGGENLEVAVTLHELDVCAEEAGRQRDAEGSLKQISEESKLEGKHLVGCCVEETE